MTRPKDVSEQKWRNAVHEAGHVWADHVADFGPYEVNLATARGAATYSCVPPTLGDDARVAVSYLAGGAAERAIGFDDQLTKDGESSDLQRLGSFLSHDALEEHRVRAREFVAEHLQSILRIAAGLATRDLTNGKDLLQLLEVQLPTPGIVGRIESLKTPPAASALVVLSDEPGESELLRVIPIGERNAARVRQLQMEAELLFSLLVSEGRSWSLAEIREEAPGFTFVAHQERW